MQIYDHQSIEIPAVPRGIALGMFDGVHSGHQELIMQLLQGCARRAIRPAVLSFSDHPDLVFRPKADFPGFLADDADRLSTLKAMGVRELIWLPLIPEIYELEPEAFLDLWLKEKLGVQYIVVGRDFTFGYHSAGDVQLLTRWCDAQGIDCLIVDDVEVKDEKVSSTRIRQLIHQGDLDMADQLLGRPYAIKGTVRHGKKLGRRLGFPTVNIPFPQEMVQPPSGVYFSQVVVEGATHEAITNIGYNPTVDQGLKHALVETVLFDFDGDLYDRQIRVELLHFARPEQSFSSVAALKEQVHQDMAQCRHYHETLERPVLRRKINGIPLWVCRSKRFIQGAVRLVFRVPLRRHDRSCYNLLLRLLISGNHNYPNQTKLARALAELYGADLYCDAERQGDIQILTLGCDALIRAPDGSAPLQDVISLLFDCLLKPAFSSDGNWLPEQIDVERENLKLELLAEENDKMRFAYQQALQQLGGEQNHVLNPAGDREELDNVTGQQLQTAWRRLLAELQVTAYAIGTFDTPLLEELTQQLARLPDTSRTRLAQVQPTPFYPAAKPAAADERKLDQAMLIQIWSGMPEAFSRQRMTGQMLNSLLGGDVHSLLFRQIRETLGLAYQSYSLYHAWLGLLITLTGVRPEQIAETAGAVRDQLAALQQGQLSEELLETSRTQLRAAIQNRSDAIGGLLAQMIESSGFGPATTVRDQLALLEQITREDVVLIASRLTPALDYVLRPEAGEEA